MKILKRTSILLVTLIVVLCYNVLNANPIHAAETTNVRPITDIFNLTEYLNKDYSKYANQTHNGAYYKVGNWGHRMQADVGSISLEAIELERLTDRTNIDMVSSIKIENEYTYAVLNQVTTTVQVKVGIQQILKTVAKLGNVGEVGQETKMTTEYSFATVKTHAETLTKSKKIIIDYNLDSLDKSKNTFSISRVAIVLKVHINKSCTQEHKWAWGKYYWSDFADTIKKNYDAYYYIDDLVTFVYNDDTFGTIGTGLYELGTIKNY